MLKKFFAGKENAKTPSMKRVNRSICPKCGAESIYRVDGITDMSLWCTTCGWKQIDYSLNKASIY